MINTIGPPPPGPLDSSSSTSSPNAHRLQEHVNLTSKYFIRVVQICPPSLVRLIEFGACLCHQDQSN